MIVPVAGTCPTGAVTACRACSNRPDASHRRMTDRAVREQVVASGWLAEDDGPDLTVMHATQSDETVCAISHTGRPLAGASDRRHPWRRGRGRWCVGNGVCRWHTT